MVATVGTSVYKCLCVCDMFAAMSHVIDLLPYSGIDRKGLSRQQAGTSSLLDLLLGELREELGLDNDRNRDLSVAEELEVTE